MLNVAPFNHDMAFNLFKLSVIRFSFENHGLTLLRDTFNGMSIVSN